MPRVAIITRTRDRHVLLRRAIESVDQQTFGDWQHIIVNDGGDAKSLDAFLNEIGAETGDSRKVIHHSESQGMQAALNAGIAASESEFVTVHDDDDSWDPKFLESCVGFLDEKGKDDVYQGVITKTLAVIERIKDDRTVEEVSRQPYVPLDEVNLFRIGFENPFPPIAFCYRRQAHDDIGPYNEQFSYVGDMDFNFRFLTRYEIGVIREPLAFYHWREKADGSSPLDNSVTGGREIHARLYNEFKNHYLRGGNPDVKPEQALALNMARYLVEIEWITADDYHRGRRLEPKIDQLYEELCGPGFRDRFESIRHGLAILIDHAKNPGLRNRIEAIQDLVQAQRDWLQQPTETPNAIDQKLGEETSPDRISSIVAALAFLVDRAKDPRLLAELEILRESVRAQRDWLQQPTETPNAIDERLGLESSPDRISSIVAALALLIDRSNDPRPSREVEALREALGSKVEALLESVRAQRNWLQQPTETPNAIDERLGHESSPDRISSLLNGMAFVMDHLRDPHLRQKANEAASGITALKESNAALQQSLQRIEDETCRHKTLLRIGPLCLEWKRKASRNAPPQDSSEA